MADELLTVDEVANELKLHPDTVRRYIREKRLLPTRVGGRLRIRRSELDRFLSEGDKPEEEK